MLAGTAFGAYSLGRAQSPAALSEEDSESVALYAEALDAVREDYVDRGEIDPERQTYGAIEGMLDTLGDEGHTRFLSPEEREQNDEGLSGTYVGVGIQLEEEGGDVVVAAPIPGSPAEAAGVRSGDVLVAVNGESVREEDVSGIVEKVTGPEGTRVEITASRDGEEKVFDLERAEIKTPAVSWSRLRESSGDVAHVQLTSFSDNSAEEVEEAFSKAEAAGATRFVLDLRSNPGGRLDQAVRMAELFLEPGETVYVRKDASGEREAVEAGEEAGGIEAPLAVLVNGGSASSSEILAGTLRDNDRAPVVGETTFGTGTVLSEFVLRDGSSMLLGVAEWLTPDGDFIRETGIAPDVKVTLGEDGEPLTPREARGLPRGEISSTDPQLARAVEELPEE